MLFNDLMVYLIAFGAGSLFALLVSIFFRTVVDTNKVHIVQYRKQTVSYGAKQNAGNVYYRWPRWIPIIGITDIVLPVNNFDLSLTGYKAYDKERVPFELDVTAFFCISDTNIAAQRVENFEALKHQLLAIVQGAVRKILASNDINQIMVDRATFGKQFTEEVTTELANWGVSPVKNMELMDIRDADGSKVIANIMAKKASHIEMESRTEVAKNMQAAETAEIEAKRSVDISQQQADQAVGERTADKERAVGVAQQKAAQDVKVEEAITKEKDMLVQKVGMVKGAENAREAALVEVDQQKQVTVITAEGVLEATKRKSEGIRIEGEAKAGAEQAMLMAPVNAQIALADKIGSNAGYQTYLLTIEAIAASKNIGVEQAKALVGADVKIIANAGTAMAGANSAMQLFTPQGGLSIGGMLETLASTPQGKEFLDALKNKFGVGKETSTTTKSAE